MYEAFSRVVFEYETQKMVQINSKKIGAMFRITQIAILAYLIGWVMIYQRGYQTSDKAISGISIKLKGLSYMNLTGTTSTRTMDRKLIPAPRVFDPADYVVPPQQNSAFFIMTNLVMTENQTQGVCPESEDVYGSGCRSDADCHAEKLPLLGNGRLTGRCVPGRRRQVCEIHGWCPTEVDQLPETEYGVNNNAHNFTVLLKNSIEFPVWKVKRRNVLSWMSKSFLQSCIYQPDHSENRFCPIFRLGDILKYAEADTQDVWVKGGMVSIKIDWECDLDFSEEYCIPKYSFRRLDDANSLVANGWNFRYADFYMMDNIQHRNLIKAYGIQFFISVSGTAYKFDLYTFTMNIGSGIGLFGVATLVCDMIILHILRNRGLYRNAKTDFVPVEHGDREDQRPHLNSHSNSQSFGPRDMVLEPSRASGRNIES